MNDHLQKYRQSDIKSRAPLKLPSSQTFLECLMNAHDSMQLVLAGFYIDRDEAAKNDDKYARYNRLVATMSHTQEEFNQTAGNMAAQLHDRVISSVKGLVDLEDQTLDKRPDIVAYPEEEKKLLEAAAASSDERVVRNIYLFCAAVRMECHTHDSSLPEARLESPLREELANYVRIVLSKYAQKPETQSLPQAR